MNNTNTEGKDRKAFKHIPPTNINKNATIDLV